MIKLIFIYNANSGIGTAVMDSLHRVFSSKTYKCQLCKMTYGLTSMKDEWRVFVRNLPYESTFYHIDEFEAEFPNQSLRYPTIAVHEDDTIVELISPAQLGKVESLDELMSLVSRYLPKDELELREDSGSDDF